MIFIILAIILCLPTIFLTTDFIRYLIIKKRIFKPKINRVLEYISIIGLPLFYFVGYDEKLNDCCSDSATFAPEHKLTIICLIIIGIFSYHFSANKEKIISPIIETIINSVLLGGIILNIILSIQIEQPLWLIGNLPIIIIFIFELIKNQKKVSEYCQSYDYHSLNEIEKIAWKILNSVLIFKIPVLLILCLPILVLVSSFLLLFGQKPDSMIKAFTETYKHGFSQLDYMCENVICGGHFLCSVGANGHKIIVRPVRYGERNGNKIICTRQLLVSNAFEELIQEKHPRLHKFIRKRYNKVGSAIHKHYHIFNKKLVSDFVYILMKPLELIFIITLYSVDNKPENRIASQYLSQIDKNKIEGI